jgi:hypothetical protein
LSARTARACRKAIENHSGFPGHLHFQRLFGSCPGDSPKQRSRRKESLLCTSGVIESVFGCYKNELSENPMSGITGMALITCINIRFGRSRDKKNSQFVYMRSAQAMVR